MNLKKIILMMLSVGILALGGAYFWAVNIPALEPISKVDSTTLDSESVENGRQLAAVGDCAVCHTKAGGESYAGGLSLPTPFGVLYSTNITPDLNTGIGNWSEQAFQRAMQEGLDREGNHLYPAFPYDHFTKVSEEDIRDIYNYIMSLEPVEQVNQPNELNFPFSFRPLLAGWKLLFLNKKPFQPNPELNDEQNRGAYLVKGLAHCSACHSPRNVFGAISEKTFFQGGQPEGWYAPALGVHSTSAAPWSIDNYLDYLFDGWSEAHGIAAGPMTPVIEHLSDADEDDIYAIAEYLGTLTPEVKQEEIDRVVEKVSAYDWVKTETIGSSTLTLDDGLLNGEQTFVQNCVKCHKERISKKQPVSLGLSSVISAPTPENFFHIVINGIKPPYNSGRQAMESMGIAVPKDKLVDLARYVRKRFSSQSEWTDLEAYLEKSTLSNH
ncbi:MAG: cytochrome c [Proteobacteria bacterium]|nr:cytochrome c [Pseudomonadota bacterium]MDA1237583.1 cytochrome c [Pseudomonadota bacterium]